MNWIWIVGAVGVVIVLAVLVLGGMGIVVALMSGKGKPARKPAPSSKAAPAAALDDPDNSPFVELAEARERQLIHGACRAAVDDVVQKMHPGLAPKPPVTP